VSILLTQEGDAKEMAVFTEQISSQVTSGVKNALASILIEDRQDSPNTSEADVIRTALALGLPLLEDWPIDRRSKAYAMLRRGLEIPTAASVWGRAESEDGPDR